MVVNSYYECEYCKTKLRLRYQVGYFDIPVNIYCPKCNSHISGSIFIDNDNISISENLIGAIKVSHEDYEYVYELSTEFLVDKCKTKEETKPFDLTMFMRSNPFDEEKRERQNNLLWFNKNILTFINRIENVYNLLNNKKIDLIKRFFLESDDVFLKDLRMEYDYNKIINKVDAMLATKHYVNTLLMRTMPKRVFENIYNVMHVKVRRIVTNHPNEMKRFLSYLDEDYLELYLNRIPKFIVDYIKVIGQLIPIYDNYSNFNVIDFGKKGISTLSIDAMSVIYKKGYELLCDSIDLVIGLYNIESNGQFDIFTDGRYDFTTKLNSYNSKYNKFETFTSFQSDLFDGIKGTLNNVIRNAEGHNSIFIDGIKQEVTFVNKHKGKKTTYTISFLEFGKMCIDLYVAILYIWEYCYQLTKLKAVLVDAIELNYGK